MEISVQDVHRRTLSTSNGKRDLAQRELISPEGKARSGPRILAIPQHLPFHLGTLSKAQFCCDVRLVLLQQWDAVHNATPV